VLETPNLGVLVQFDHGPVVMGVSLKQYRCKIGAGLQKKFGGLESNSSVVGVSAKSRILPSRIHQAILATLRQGQRPVTPTNH
jgi:hypothetical protein